MKYLLSLSSDGPNVNKAIKTIINSKIKANHQRKLVDTGPCQLHVVHNSFRKGVEGYGSNMENLCIDICHIKLNICSRQNTKNSMWVLINSDKRLAAGSSWSPGTNTISGEEVVSDAAPMGAIGWCTY